ncbi:Permease of the drug/metabolite transporter (DMT) superfamily [Anaerosphaera aminiphila DSM 21120]|uniref:Permease of the drug/metabolite transporter (DMT) superfamily n=1 Tax=Anaerosphaera aminiphila DSM 21120 TaxID=1120995 RepID=A0A1M5T7F9_9FIRM|nr:DMT family transporter [Anaerosphaera aminiphila]SHH46644.1 Permease of the drug/metabolite transporter (DMT) superfamily [Anaerosphaera aminiphila DSM 21120]
MHKRETNMLKGLIFTMLGAIFWGFSGTCGQYLLNTKGLNPQYIVNVRLVFSGVILFIISLFQNGEKTFLIFKNKNDTVKLVLFAILGILCCQYAYLQAIARTNAPTATVLQFLSTVFIMIGVCVKEKRLPHIVEVASIILAVLGTVILATHLKLNTLVISPDGLFWGLLAAFGVVMYTLLPIELLHKYPTSVVTGSAMIIGGAIITLINKPWTQNVNFDVMTVLALSGMVLFGTVFSFSLFLTGVSIIGPVKGSLITGLEAVSALVFSILLLGERFTLMDLLGMLSILFAVSILSLKKE